MSSVRVSEEVHDSLRIAKVEGGYRTLNDVIADAIDVEEN